MCCAKNEIVETSSRLEQESFKLKKEKVFHARPRAAEVAAPRRRKVRFRKDWRETPEGLNTHSSG